MKRFPDRRHLEYNFFSWLLRVCAWCYVKAVYMGGKDPTQRTNEIFQHNDIREIPERAYVVFNLEVKSKDKRLDLLIDWNEVPMPVSVNLAYLQRFLLGDIPHTDENARKGISALAQLEKALHPVQEAGK